MSDQPRRRLSRRLSYVLRHDPASIDLRLDPAGWATIPDLLAALTRHGHPLTRADLDAVVGTDPKGRFTVVADRIRAAQGHSIPVDLGLEQTTPPAVLFHGSVAAHRDSIAAHGLSPRGRRHVHLSADRATALTVGARHGEPVVLEVDAAAAHADGCAFFVAANGVWLTDHVPAHLVSWPT